MKKLIAGVVIIVIAVIAWLAFKGPSNKINTSTANNPASSTSNSNTQNSQRSTNSVTIQNFAFSPANITVKKGTTVTWTNQDSTGHTVTESDSQAGPASQILGNGQSYSFTFSQTGTFHYHCTIHTEMNGVVTVTE